MRKQFSKEFKAKVALAALKGERTIGELGSQYGIHPNRIGYWKKTVQENLPEVFGNGKTKVTDEKDKLIEELYKTIGQLKMENDWLKKKLNF